MDEGVGSRRGRALPRSDSDGSSNTRMTPSSSNSSIALLPQRVQDLTARGVSGSLLQDRLRERKVESARLRRSSIDMAERDVQSSPVKGSRADRRPSSSGLLPGKTMGVKQIQDAVSTLHKQNFDLKLELFHRRQRQETLEAKLEAAERKLDEQAELAEINDDLLAELEKRDQAVEEAVGIIVQLEEKVDSLIQEREDVKAFDASYEPGHYPPEDFSSSPPRFEKEPLPKRISRMPSFLSETTEGNEALRSLYLPYNGHSDSTLPRLSEGAHDGMDSPRLSMLSESSFVSVYGNKLAPLAPDEPGEPRRHRKSSSIEKWVADRPVAVATPPRVMQSLRKSQFLSINDVLESPLQRLEKLKHTLEKTEKGLNPAKHVGLRDRRRSRERRQVSTENQSFERQHTLPPTPDTMSTNTLRDFRSSTDTLSQTPTDHTFPNRRSGFPDTARRPFQSQPSIRPRSAGETVTSRREGHGWDTPSQEDNTDAGSMSSALSTISAQSSGQERAVTPELFPFPAGDWGRGYEPALPAHTASRHDALRRSRTVDHARSDDTVMSCTYDDSAQYRSNPINTTPKPELPDRRSSLLAVTKIRKSNPDSAPPPNASPVSKERRSRIPNLRMFGRGDSAPPASSPTKASFSPGLPRPKASNPKRSSGHFADSINTNGSYDEEQSRATPPPIMRSRPGQSYAPATGVGHSRRGGSSVGGQEAPQVQGHTRRDSVNAAANGDGATKDEDTSKGKKWFGLGVGRSNSTKRN